MRQPDRIISCANVLGEGPVWDALGGRLLWTDIQSRQLNLFDPASGRHDVLPMPERLCAFALIDGDNERLLAAFETGFGVLDLRDQSVRWLSRPELGGTGRRFNDGRVDRQGRFWCGTMVENADVAGENTAQLWRVGLDGAITAQRSGIAISNGACFSPDGRTMYFADSPRQLMLAMDLCPETGDILGEWVFAKVTDGYPDGATVDAEGCVWSARWGAGVVVRHAPDGRVIDTLSLPVSQPTSVAFGGANLKTLFVTSARDELSPADLSAQPLAGAVFQFDLDVAGLAEPRFAGTLDR